MRFRTRNAIMTTVAALAAAGAMPAAHAQGPARETAVRGDPVVRELTSFAAPGCAGGCGSGSTVGPDGALYVTDGPAGRVLRVDPETGATSTYADGLPRAVPEVGIGGAMDVVFLHGTAYVLVTLVGPEFGRPDVVAGVYRIGKGGRPSVLADVGAWSAAHPPETDFFIASGVQYALERRHGGLLVSDGHHNRVLRVSRDGDIRQLRAFGNVVPTGLDVHGRTIYMAEAGPIPHRPADGRVIGFSRTSPVAVVAGGAPLLVDVERGRGGRVYALSQGVWDLPPTPENEGKPASPNTGSLLLADRRGGLVPVVEGLDRPTSVELSGGTAFVVTLTGKVLRIDGLSCERRSEVEDAPRTVKIRM
ncbi:MAG: ScyD/ScyE family protein [Thermoleophilia bacterium]|nr:ScyD/ScyE family protein [Thermoleophilia bacterium]